MPSLIDLTYLALMIKFQLCQYILLCFIPFMSSCGLLNKKGNWGKNALYPVKAERIIWSLKKNLSSAHVWLPVAGAGVIVIGNYEDKISNWIAEEKHIFPDHKTADDWSDINNQILKYQTYASTLLTPSANEENSWGDYLQNKVRGAAVVVTSTSLPRYFHDRISETFPRQRPNKADMRSFPSSHATKASAYNMINIKNYEAINMDSNFRIGLITLNTGMAVITSWARVEGHRHNPTDVMIGYALGSFMSGFIYDSLMNHDPAHSLVILPMNDAWATQYIVQF